MSALEELRRHAEELQAATGVSVQLLEGTPQIYVVLGQVPLPPGAYNIAATDVLFIADQQYPLSSLDMFWVEPQLLRADGSVPQNAEAFEAYAERRWRRFSWHRFGVWNPNGNGLLDHFAFMQARFDVDTPR